MAIINPMRLGRSAWASARRGQNAAAAPIDVISWRRSKMRSKQNNGGELTVIRPFIATLTTAPYAGVRELGSRVRCQAECERIAEPSRSARARHSILEIRAFVCRRYERGAHNEQPC